MFFILCSLLIYPFLVLSLPNLHGLSIPSFDCSVNYPTPSSPVSCSILISRVLANSWARESRFYSRFEPQSMPTHLPHFIRYLGCQFTLSSAPEKEDTVENMVLADYGLEMAEMISQCIVAGFPGVLAYVGPGKRVQMAISGEWDPLTRFGLGNVTRGLPTSRLVPT